MRLIDADVLKEVIEEKVTYIDGDSVYKIIDLIDNAPTVEPIERIGSICEENCGYRPQGEWIFHKDFNESCRYGCNQCGNLNNIQSNFCPNCGARMVKGGAK